MLRRNGADGVNVWDFQPGRQRCVARRVLSDRSHWDPYRCDQHPGWDEAVLLPTVPVRSVSFLHTMHRSKSMSRIVAAAKRLVVRQAGATMVEYGLMLFLIAVVCLAVIALLGTKLSSVFNDIVTSL
jgi:pilus assembly protein Flp/PilA